jgi:hypothetical protein
MFSLSRHFFCGVIKAAQARWQAPSMRLWDKWLLQE